MKACTTSCIGCGKCAKDCPVEAIEMTTIGNLVPPAKIAKIDYNKCIQCGKCVSECPRGAIVKIDA